MTRQGSDKILAGRPAVNFVGRDEIADRLAVTARSADGLFLLATPGAGASELLKQTYDRLFREQQEIIPFYFAIRNTFRTRTELAESFLNDFIHQLIAFRRREPALAGAAVGLDELHELSLSVSGIWIDRMIDTARSGPASRDFVRSCLGSPARASIHGARSFVLIDDVHAILGIDGGAALFEELKEIYEGADLSFVFSGQRRFLHQHASRSRLELRDLKPDAAGRLVEVLAEEHGVKLNEQPRDLIATQLSGNPAMVQLLIREAADSMTELNSFADVEKVYADGVFGGGIGKRFDNLFTDICRSTSTERAVFELLREMQRSETGRIEIEMWRRRLRLGEVESYDLLNKLHRYEAVRLGPTFVESMRENTALTDYIEVRHQVATTRTRASVFGEMLGRYIKRAPDVMAKRYHATWSVGVREVLGAFDGRKVPTVLLDYRKFRDELKGMPDQQLLDAAAGSDPVALPRIFFTTAASSFYKPIAQVAADESAAIALGFEARDEDANDEVVWIAAEIESKLETSLEVAEFWCDRLEAAALMCDFRRFRIWLIAPEGFSTEALDLLDRRAAYGSSRRQVDLLRIFLNAPPSTSEQLAANEYEIVIPMDGDSEMVAAHAVEEIARRHDLDTRSINQIKTALVEACINASEHSSSPDRKIYQRFRVEDDRVVLTVSNRGLRLTSKLPATEPNEGRRGWGLKLMRNLMDEVTVENVDDGTRIVMTKYLKAA
jgi:serine/threonine-protein kinase RsbW